MFGLSYFKPVRETVGALTVLLGGYGVSVLYWLRFHIPADERVFRFDGRGLRHAYTI